MSRLEVFFLSFSFRLSFSLVRPFCSLFLALALTGFLMVANRIQSSVLFHRETQRDISIVEKGGGARLLSLTFSSVSSIPPLATVFVSSFEWLAIVTHYLQLALSYLFSFRFLFRHSHRVVPTTTRRASGSSVFLSCTHFRPILVRFEPRVLASRQSMALAIDCDKISRPAGVAIDQSTRFAARSSSQQGQ